MISEKSLTRSVSRFRLTKYFPGSDPEILTALAVELKKLCVNDAELGALTDAAIEAGGEWCGIGTLQDVSDNLKREREAKERRAAAFRWRDRHEATCTGRDESGRPCEAAWTEEVWIGMGSGWSVETICSCRKRASLAA